MSSTAPPPAGAEGDWVELDLVVLGPDERAPGLPPDTAAAPLRARVKGFLERDARVGEPAAVRTLAGRRVEGTLLRVAPVSGHSFGEAQPELLAVGPELRAFLSGTARG
ncbi:MAG: 2-amino-4-oxopentanoate thiolase subunit OrtA [Gaiellales bacterium]